MTEVLLAFDKSVLWFPLGFVIFLYVIAPLGVRKKQRLNTRRSFVRIDPEELSEESAEYFSATAPGFAEWGFELADYVRQRDAVSLGTVDQFGEIALWINPLGAQLGMATTIHTRAKNVKPTVLRYIEFSTALADGSEVLTNNSRVLSNFMPVPAVHSLYAGTVRDVSELYRLHLSREARIVPPGAPRYVPAPGSEIACLPESIPVSMLRQEKAGIYRRCREPGEFRPTPIGAFLMTWSLLPPLKQIRAFFMRRRERKEIKEARTQPLTASRAVAVTHESPHKKQLEELNDYWDGCGRA